MFARYRPLLVQYGAQTIIAVDAPNEMRYTGRLPYCRAMACQNIHPHPYYHRSANAKVVKRKSITQHTKRNIAPVPEFKSPTVRLVASTMGVSTEYTAQDGNTAIRQYMTTHDVARSFRFFVQFSGSSGSSEGVGTRITSCAASECLTFSSLVASMSLTVPGAVLSSSMIAIVV